jgi:DNA modification methylase
VGGGGVSASRPSVWPVAQRPARFQRQGRYLPASSAHPGKMLPALARTAITTYTQPGELVVDPMCGIGTTLLEAIHLDRRAVGVELERRWVTLAAANLLHARKQGAAGQALALQGDARRLGRGLLDEYVGEVALILTSPPYGSSLHGQVKPRPGRVEKFDDRYSHNKHNLAELPAARARGDRPTFSQALEQILAGCRRLLRPGGRLVITVRPYRRSGELVDLPGQLTALALHAGFELEARNVALLCALRHSELVPRASFFQLRHQRSGAIPNMLLIAHEDALVLRVPEARTPRRRRPETTKR